jgi:hypothetical protein
LWSEKCDNHSLAAINKWDDDDVDYCLKFDRHQFPSTIGGVLKLANVYCWHATFRRFYKFMTRLKRKTFGADSYKQKYQYKSKNNLVLNVTIFLHSNNCFFRHFSLKSIMVNLIVL